MLKLGVRALEFGAIAGADLNGEPIIGSAGDVQLIIQRGEQVSFILIKPDQAEVYGEQVLRAAQKGRKLLEEFQRAVE